MFLEVGEVLTAVGQVFIQEDLSFANDRLTLTDGRREKLFSQIQNAAGTTAEHIARTQVASRRRSLDMITIALSKALANKARRRVSQAAAGGASATGDEGDGAAIDGEDGTSGAEGVADGSAGSDEPPSPGGIGDDSGDDAGASPKAKSLSRNTSTSALRLIKAASSRNIPVPGVSPTLLSDMARRGPKKTPGVGTVASPAIGLASQLTRARKRTSSKDPPTRPAPIAEDNAGSLSSKDQRKPYGFGPRTVIVDVDTVLWLCLNMFIEQCSINKARMQDMCVLVRTLRWSCLFRHVFHWCLQVLCLRRGQFRHAVTGGVPHAPTSLLPRPLV